MKPNRDGMVEVQPNSDNKSCAIKGITPVWRWGCSLAQQQVLSGRAAKGLNDETKQEEKVQHCGVS